MVFFITLIVNIKNNWILYIFFNGTGLFDQPLTKLTVWGGPLKEMKIKT